jgi:iron transport multicopper oxidase
MFDELPPGFNPDFFGYLVSNPAKPLPAKTPMPEKPQVVDDINFVTSTSNWFGQVAEYTNVDVQLIWNMNFTNATGQTR